MVRSADAPPQQIAAADMPLLIGPAYDIGGVRYVPADIADHDEVGYAGIYGAAAPGATTANGESLAAGQVAGAHHTLPLPSYVEVTRLDTGRTILVRINDRGPAGNDRILALSPAAATQLGLPDGARAAVRVRRTNPNEAERLALRSGGMVPARLDTPESLLVILREQIARRTPPPLSPTLAPTPDVGTRSAVVVVPVPASTAAAVPADLTIPATAAAIAAPTAPARGRYLVQLGAFASAERADALARATGGRVERVGVLHAARIGPFVTEAQARAAIARAGRDGHPGGLIVRNR